MIEYLEEHGSASTPELYQYINERSFQGCTTNRLGNLVSKDPRFELVGAERYKGRTTTYLVNRYKLADDYKEWTYRKR